jgi:dTDP-4-dehydrorhamnose reductase
MKILLLGALGQLGQDLQKVLAGHEIVPLDREEIDVQVAGQVDAAVDGLLPDIVINCTAFHRVDECEDQISPTFGVNVYAVRHLALAARRVNIPLVHFSTDYVFDGPQRRPHPETDLPSPKCVYAVSKLAGELMLQSIWPKHFIVRSCGLYGYAGSREKGTNFVETMLKLGASGNPLKIVHDQVCTPTATLDLARAVEQVIATERYGLYHLTAGGECSWYEFAKAIFELAQLHPEVCPVTSDAFPMKAKRPDYSVLDNANLRATGLADMRPWREALADYIHGRKAAGRA